jgi:ribosomal-protein-alanine N-acetyltransferase
VSGDRSGIVLREAGPLDARVIAELHLQCFADGRGGAAWSAAPIVKVLSLPGSYAYLAAAAPETATRAAATEPVPAEPVPAGFLLARALAGESEILSLGVAAAWRRHGTARALLRAAMTRASQAGAARTLLEVAEDNMAARGLYAAEGFALVNRRPRYYRRPGGAAAAALVFARELP